MKYNGIELDKNKIDTLEKPIAMFVWNQYREDHYSDIDEEECLQTVYALVNIEGQKHAVTSNGVFPYYAEIPKPKTRKRTASEKLTYLYKMMNDLCKDEYVISRSKSENRWSEGQAFVIDYLQEDEYKFAILHIDDSMTHFEIPEIEVNDE